MPLKNYRNIRFELKKYKSILATKREIVALSKIDLKNPKAEITINKINSLLGKDALMFSSKNGKGIKNLISFLKKELLKFK